MTDVSDAEDLKIKIKTKAHENHLEPQDIMQMYFFERLLYRIGISEYKYNFILKGGLLLSAIFGDERRTTQDMDTMLKGIPLEVKTLEKIIKEIIGIDGKDGITFEIVSIKDIRLIDKYGGLKVKLIGYKEHLRVPLAIDVTVGDPITPKELNFRYKCMFDDAYVNIMAFNKETIIAEKFETFITDNIMNTRAKDFYDLYILLTRFYNDINKDDLVKAIKNTFERRAAKFDINIMVSNFDLIKNSKKLRANFNRFKLKKVYVKDISYEEVMDAIEIIIKLVQRELTLVS